MCVRDPKHDVIERAHARMSSSGDKRERSCRFAPHWTSALSFATGAASSGLSQTVLARKVGVGRQWVVAIERGKSRAELGLVLRTLSALGLSITSEADNRPPRPADDLATIDIDAVVSNARHERR